MTVLKRADDFWIRCKKKGLIIQICSKIDFDDVASFINVVSILKLCRNDALLFLLLYDCSFLIDFIKYMYTKRNLLDALHSFKSPSRNYRVLIKYCVFSFKYCDFSELWQCCCSAGVLPAWCVYTHWHRGKTEKGQNPEY